MGRPNNNRERYTGSNGEFLWRDIPLTQIQARKQVLLIYRYLEAGHLRAAQIEARKLYNALYEMGLLPELNE